MKIFSKKNCLFFFIYIEAQENADEYSNEVEQLRGTVARNEEEKQRLEAELLQIKEMLQREVARADAESRRSNVIIAEYKQVLVKHYYIPHNTISSFCIELQETRISIVSDLSAFGG